jgi:phosphoribosylformylglycinamidine synthase
LFSESPTRFLLEVRPDAVADVQSLFEGLPVGEVGTVTETPRLIVRDSESTLIDAPLSALKEAWQAPLRW